MSILIGVESADFVFIRQQTGATAGNLSVQLDKLAKANYIEIEKTFRGKMPCTVCPHHRHGTRRLRRIRRGVTDLYPEIKRPQETRGTQRQEVPGRNRNYRTHGLPDSAAAPQSDSLHVRTRTGFDLYLPAPAGIFIAANNYSVQKNVTRNGTLKSSVQPWKIETAA